MLSLMSGSRKIYFVVNARIPTDRAHGIQIMNMCEAFGHAGADVHLIVPRRYNSASEDPFSYYGVEKNFSIVYLPTLDFTASLPGGFVLQTLAFALMTRLWLFRQKEGGIVYTRGEMALFLARLLPKRFHLVWETHIKPDHSRRYQAAAHRAMLLVAATKKYAEEIPALLHIPAKKVFYAADGVSLKTFSHMPDKETARKKLSLPNDKQIIVYTGSDIAWKGVPLLRQASELLSDACLTAFVGPILPEGADSPSRLFAGARPYTEMPLWLSAADVLILLGNPKSDIARYNTSPLKLFEYMASGRPIVAIDLPSFRDILSDENAFFAAPDAQGLAETISFALAHPEDASRRALHAKEAVAKYSWNMRVQNILSSIDHQTI